MANNSPFEPANGDYISLIEKLNEESMMRLRGNGEDVRARLNLNAPNSSRPMKSKSSSVSDLSSQIYGSDATNYSYEAVTKHHNASLQGLSSVKSQGFSTHNNDNVHDALNAFESKSKMSKSAPHERFTEKNERFNQNQFGETKPRSSVFNRNSLGSTIASTVGAAEQNIPYSSASTMGTGHTSQNSDGFTVSSEERIKKPSPTHTPLFVFGGFMLIVSMFAGLNHTFTTTFGFLGCVLIFNGIVLFNRYRKQMELYKASRRKN